MAHIMKNIFLLDKILLFCSLFSSCSLKLDIVFKIIATIAKKNGVMLNILPQLLNPVNAVSPYLYIAVPKTINNEKRNHTTKEIHIKRLSNKLKAYFKRKNIATQIITDKMLFVYK
jgi:hypothetical protein